MNTEEQMANIVDSIRDGVIESLANEDLIEHFLANTNTIEDKAARNAVELIVNEARKRNGLQKV